MNFRRSTFSFSLDETDQKLITTLTDKPSYLKWSPSRIAKQFNYTEEQVQHALAYIAQTDNEQISGYAPMVDDKKEEHNSDYQKFLVSQNINEEDVTQVYFKENAKGVRFTVQTRHKQKDIDNESLYKFLSTKSFELPPSQEYTPSNTVALLDITDAHIDKMSYVGEGGTTELLNNLRLLKTKFRSLLDDILKEKPETIVFPIGSDFFNTNGSIGETKKGTPQQISVHWEDSFQAGVDFYRSCIDEMITTCNVILVDIGGNHDQDKVFYLGQILKAIYENDERVTMHIGKDRRKYVFVNDILMGFEHGDIAKKKIHKLPNTMAIEQPELWGKAKHRTWILGDIHHKEKYTSLSTLEEQGVEIKFLRPATSADRWHIDNQWNGAKKSLTAIIYQNSAEKIKEIEIFF